MDEWKIDRALKNPLNFRIFYYKEADEDEQAAVAAVETPAAAKTSGKKRLKLINQFNYCERAALTYNNPSRVCIFIPFTTLFCYQILICLECWYTNDTATKIHFC